MVHASCRLPEEPAGEDPLSRVEALLPHQSLLFSLTFTQIASIGGVSSFLVRATVIVSLYPYKRYTNLSYEDVINTCSAMQEI